MEKGCQNDDIGRAMKLIGPSVLSEKYKTTAHVIRQFILAAGWSVTPNDLSKFPDFPQKSEDMSQEQYQEIINEYWIEKSKERKEDESTRGYPMTDKYHTEQNPA